MPLLSLRLAAIGEHQKPQNEESSKLMYQLSVQRTILMSKVIVAELSQDLYKF